MGFLGDYPDADPNHKSIRLNGITTFLLHVAHCIIFDQTKRVKTILIDNASLKSFYSRLGFKVIKDFENLLILKRLASDFIMSQENLKQIRKKIVLQCLQTIPRRVIFLHDNRINLNIQKCVQKFIC